MLAVFITYQHVNGSFFGSDRQTDAAINVYGGCNISVYITQPLKPPACEFSILPNRATGPRSGPLLARLTKAQRSYNEAHMNGNAVFPTALLRQSHVREIKFSS
jgi:hypothetical protein